MRRLGLGGRVRFHGALAPEAVPEALREFDIAVAPYPAGENYFSPLKVYEYLAAGLPSSHRRRRDPGVLADTGAAILTDPADTADLTDALQRLIDDAELRATMGQRAREEALTSHSWTRRCQQILAPVGSRPRTPAVIS